MAFVGQTAGMGRFTDRVAIVTGAASGLGRCVAGRLAAEGARVAVVDIDGDAAGAAAHDIGPSAVGMAADVSREPDVARAVDATVEHFGRLDLLHNNAAALGADVFPHDRGLTELDVEVWDRAMAVNARGTMLFCKHAIPAMVRGGGGAIVNTASASALIGEDVHAAYGASKAAVVALTRYVATMHGADGIRCNAVAPGMFLSPVARERLSEAQRVAFRAERLVDHEAEPDDVANLVLFLLSDDAAYITGQTSVIDGGTLAHRPRHAMKAWDAAVAAGRVGRGESGL
jgi:NAD(P)-dependent dehydrogenase (short-subunit alcohol dehydrogenase family)